MHKQKYTGIYYIYLFPYKKDENPPKGFFYQRGTFFFHFFVNLVKLCDSTHFIFDLFKK